MARENYKLVPYFAQRYVKKHQLRKNEKEELIQEGYCGFMKACSKYNASLGYKLSTYSGWWVRKYMDDYIKSVYKQKELISYDEHLYQFISVEEEFNSVLEDYSLHDWEKNNIFPKRKKDTLAQLTIETVLNLRCFLIDKKVNGFRDEVKENQLYQNHLEEVVNYSKLKKLLSEKLNRVL